MGPVLVELAALDRRVQARRPHPVLGTGSLHGSVIEGGVEASSYPASCVLTGEWRTVPGIAQLVRRHAGTGFTGPACWADSALLSAAGIPTVLYGPSGAGAHADDEWVDLASVSRVRDVLVAVAREFLG